jgi:RimJ/RimL family protein N-acetyltransferase
MNPGAGHSGRCVMAPQPAIEPGPTPPDLLDVPPERVGRVEAALREDRSALFPYELGAAYWGRGLATEARRRAIAALRSEFGAEMIVADVDTRNAASIRLLERLGFERGRETPGADRFKGSVSDEIRYTLRVRMSAT